MRKDITKKFLGKETRFAKRMTSQDISRFMYNKIKTTRIDAYQGYDLIEFSNVFNTKMKTSLNISNKPLMCSDKERNIVSQNNKMIEFNMVYCDIEKTNNCVSFFYFDLENSFFIGETLVTQELYEFVMGINPSFFKDISKYPNAPKHPIEQVSWYDAIEFCNKLSKLQGLGECYEITNMTTKVIYGESTTIADVDFYPKKNGYRLPRVNEWEYARIAGTNNQYGLENDNDDIGLYGWSSNNSNYHTHPVATKKPNEWGLYDMCGNVREWCHDGDLQYKKVQIGSHEEAISTLFSYSVCVDSRNKNLGFRLAKNFKA